IGERRDGAYRPLSRVGFGEGFDVCSLEHVLRLPDGVQLCPRLHDEVRYVRSNVRMALNYDFERISIRDYFRHARYFADLTDCLLCEALSFQIDDGIVKHLLYHVLDFPLVEDSSAVDDCDGSAERFYFAHDVGGHEDGPALLACKFSEYFSEVC